MSEDNVDYRSRFYKSYISTHFGHLRDFSPEALERQRRTFRHYYGCLLPPDRNARILEVGCGYGAFLYYLRAEGYRNVEGVDISPEQVEAARCLRIPNVTCADAVEFLNRRPETYLCVVAIDFLEHFLKQEILGLLDAIYKSLKPGGRFILQSPNADGPFAGRLRYWDFTHEFALTGTSARQILETADFGEVYIFGTDPFVHNLPSLVRVLSWKVIKTLLWVYLVAETGTIRGHLLTQNLIVLAQKPKLA